MKKLCSLLICAVLLLSVGSVPLSAAAKAAAKELGFKACIATDIHHFVTDAVPTEDGKPVFYDDLGLTPTLAPALFSEFLEQAAASDADYVFLTGDLADISEITQAKAVANKLAAFEKRTGKQVFVINGNHDIDYTETPSPENVTAKSFKKIYARFGYNEALCVDPKTCSYTADLKGGYRLIAIDALKRPGDGGAALTDALENWIRTQAAAAKQDGKKLVAIMHHPLMNHFTLMSTLLPIFVIEESEKVCSLFAQCGIETVFTGHFHQNDVAVHRGTPDVYDIETTSLSCYPNEYRTAVFGKGRLELRTHPIEKIDVSVLPAGYSKAQKAQIKNDLAGYAYDCLEKEAVSSVQGYLNAEKVAGRLGVSEPAVIRALDTLLSAIAEGFELPLYGKGDTVEACAKQAGLPLPASDYATLNETAAAFIAAQLSGDEHFDSKSPLVRVLLFGTLAVLYRQVDRSAQRLRLVRALKTLAAAVDNTSVALLLRRLCSGAIAPEKLSDLLLSPLEPLLVGLTVDRAPADNNLSLSVY